MAEQVKLTGTVYKKKVSELGWHEHFQTELTKSQYPAFVREEYIKNRNQYRCIMYEGVYSGPEECYFDPDYEVIVDWDVEEV